MKLFHDLPSRESWDRNSRESTRQGDKPETSGPRGGNQNPASTDSSSPCLFTIHWLHLIPLIRRQFRETSIPTLLQSTSSPTHPHLIPTRNHQQRHRASFRRDNVTGPFSRHQRSEAEHGTLRRRQSGRDIKRDTGKMGSPIVETSERASSRGPGSGADIARIKLSYSILPPTVGLFPSFPSLSRKVVAPRASSAPHQPHM